MRSTERQNFVQMMRRMFYRDLETAQKKYTHALTQLATSGATRILDIGCGYTAPELENLKVPGILKVGIDLVEDLRTSAALSVQMARADSGQLPFHKETFNIVICKSVFEHLDDPEAVFHEVLRVLKPGGHFLFLAPNRWDYVSLVASIVPNSFHGGIVHSTTGREEEDTFPTYYKANTTRKLRHLADSVGYEIEYLNTFRQHPHYLKFNSLLYLTGIIYEQLVERQCKQLRPWILGLFRHPSLNHIPSRDGSELVELGV